MTISGEIQDSFGQTLGEDTTLTFKTGPAQAYLTGPSDPFVTLDPSSSKPLYTLYSVNYSQVRVRAFSVTPDDWTTYQTYLREYNYNDNPPDPPGRQVLNRTITIEAADDELVETNIDLSEALGAATGQLIVVVDVPQGAISSLLSKLPFGRQERAPRFTTWVQVTQIGLDAFVDHSEMVAWATSLQSGAPLADVELRLLGSDGTATTDDAGVARFALPTQSAPVLLGTRVMTPPCCHRAPTIGVTVAGLNAPYKMNSAGMSLMIARCTGPVKRFMSRLVAPSRRQTGWRCWPAGRESSHSISGYRSTGQFDHRWQH
ncbi:MAG: hypothetical protein R2932_26030 [Caldilineaceae bacterium]